MERTSAAGSRRAVGRVGACWLGAVAVLAWLNVAELQGTAGQLVHVVSTVALAPLVFAWGVEFPWLQGWHAEWLGNFVMALLSVALLCAYVIRPNRVTAGLSIGGIVWWCWIAYLALST